MKCVHKPNIVDAVPFLSTLNPPPGVFKSLAFPGVFVLEAQHAQDGRRRPSQIVSVGDWIITDEHGQYALPPERFQVLYQPLGPEGQPGDGSNAED